jgi:hypothetical protein
MAEDYPGRVDALADQDGKLLPGHGAAIAVGQDRGAGGPLGPGGAAQRELLQRRDLVEAGAGLDRARADAGTVDPVGDLGRADRGDLVGGHAHQLPPGVGFLVMARDRDQMDRRPGRNPMQGADVAAIAGGGGVDDRPAAGGVEIL